MTQTSGVVLAHLWIAPQGHKVGNWRGGDVGSLPGRADEEKRRLDRGWTVLRAYAPAAPTHPSDTDDLRRCVLLAHVGKPRKPRWCHVSDMTSHGSGMSVALCRRFGVDPDQVVGGNDPVDWSVTGEADG